MPKITIISIALFAASTIAGAVIGWVIRGGRSGQEKAAINLGWNERIAAQESEHHRLVIQNRGLMDQISGFQSSNRDMKDRFAKLSTAVKEADARRDDLQREIKDIRGNLEVAVAERNQLQFDIAARSESEISAKEKDQKIFQLSRELESWTGRLPPLIERYKKRDNEAKQLETELAEARSYIEQLENAQTLATRVERVSDPDALTNGRDASNDSTDGETNRHDHSFDTSNDDDHLTIKDDLKKIKGVGPAIEKTLNEMGIFRFQQIADMTEYEIDRVAQRLKGFHSRIYRENWIGQARELIDGTFYG